MKNKKAVLVVMIAVMVVGFIGNVGLVEVAETKKGETTMKKSILYEVLGIRQEEGFIINNLSSSGSVLIPFEDDEVEETEPYVVEVVENEEGIIEAIVVPLSLEGYLSRDFIYSKTNQTFKFINKTDRNLNLDSFVIESISGNEWDMVSATELMNSRANSEEYSLILELKNSDYIINKNKGLDLELNKNEELELKIQLELPVQVRNVGSKSEIINMYLGDIIFTFDSN